jgi:predicted nucleic acid-binding protein
MITAVDTNVLIDVLTADSEFGLASRDALRECAQTGALIACEVVWAETAARFGSTDAASAALQQLRVRYVPIDASGANLAGAIWWAYRKAGGTRNRIVSDFLVGAHASTHADRLLTRDRRFYRGPFRELKIVDPTA